VTRAASILTVSFLEFDLTKTFSLQQQQQQQQQQELGI
jgi:hypothetical protein